jgi:polyisoprenoid-binding protein YceI
MSMPLTKSAVTRWSVEPADTSVTFAVKTFWGLLTVRGRFDRFEGFYEHGPDGSQIELTIEADSLDTGNAKRDGHLRSGDFFHIAEHPQVRFVSTLVRDAGDGQLYVVGDLEAGGKSEPLTLVAKVEPTPAGLRIETTTTVDQGQLGMSTGMLGMIRKPATLHVDAVLAEVAVP